MAIYGSNFAYGDSYYKDEGHFTSDNVFIYLPNWNFPITIKYIFGTIITLKHIKSEQRRSVRSASLRQENFTVTELDDRFEVLHYLQSIKSSHIAVPLFSEPCLPILQTELNGLTSIVIKNDLSKLYNMSKLTNTIILIDFVNENNEIIDVSSITGNAINLTSTVSMHCLGSNAVIFPVFGAYFSENFTAEFLNQKSSHYNVEFVEYA